MVQLFVNFLYTSNKTLDQHRELRKRIRAYYNYLWINKKGSEFNQGASLQNDPDLSTRLQDEVALEMVRTTFPLRNVKILSKCSDECLAYIYQLMVTHIYMPGDFVCKEGEVGRELYYVERGKLGLYAKGTTWEAMKTKEPHVVLNRGTFFGEIALMLSMRRTASIKAMSIVELFVLSKESLFKLFQRYPEYQEIMRKLAEDHLVLNQDMKSNNSGLDSFDDSTTQGEMASTHVLYTDGSSSKVPSKSPKPSIISKKLLSVNYKDSRKSRLAKSVSESLLPSDKGIKEEGENATTLDVHDVKSTSAQSAPLRDGNHPFGVHDEEPEHSMLLALHRRSHSNILTPHRPSETIFSRAQRSRHSAVRIIPTRMLIACFTTFLLVLIFMSHRVGLMDAQPHFLDLNYCPWISSV